MARDAADPQPGGADAEEAQPTIPLTTPILEAKGLLTYMGSDGRRYVVFGEPPTDEELKA